MKDTAIFLTWASTAASTTTSRRRRSTDSPVRDPRARMIVLSPYARERAISHELGEFSSDLRFIEDNWGLTQLTRRDREATPMSLRV